MSQSTRIRADKNFSDANLGSSRSVASVEIVWWARVTRLT